jgi:hypothetical protein
MEQTLANGWSRNRHRPRFKVKIEGRIELFNLWAVAPRNFWDDSVNLPLGIELYV